MLDVRMAATAASGPVAIPVREGAVPEAYREAAVEGGFTGAPGTACDILGRLAHDRILLVGIGDAGNRIAFEEAGAMAVARALRAPHLTIDVRDLTAEQAAACAVGACLRAWRYDHLLTKTPDDAPRLRGLDLCTTDPAVAEAWQREKPVVAGTLFARDLVTEPSDTLTPAGFLDRLKILVEHGVTLEVLDREALREGGFGGMLAVGQGSIHLPSLGVLRWAGSAPGKPIAFVGKGITFDTGGICIKPADRMWEMRGDMAGAAVCAGAMLALALRQAARPAIAVLALAENAISGSAYRPADIITSHAGTTVEVVDTDAEGRLVLMDALSHASRQDPSAIVDLATLTGSVVTALGHEMAGCFSNNDALANAVLAAGRDVGQPAWRLPIDETHRRALDSTIADLRHCSPDAMQPDASIGAAFLSQFVDEIPWVHLDIGGMELRQETDNRHAAGASGYGVRLLNQLAEQWPI